MDVTGYAALERPQYRNSIPAVFDGVAWWASCAVFLLLETCLGLKINGAERKVTFTDPYLPEFLPELKMKGIACWGCDRGSVPRSARVGCRNQCHSASRPSGCGGGEVAFEKS